jgi:hypothetical protein
MGGRALLALALAVASVGIPANAGVAAPAQGSVTVRRTQWAGLQMDIARVTLGNRFVVRPAQANGSVTSLRPVARICGQCVVGINGDFFDQRTSQPIGGVIINRVVLRSPNTRQNQLAFRPDGRIWVGTMKWRGQLSSGGVTIPVAVNDPNAPSPVLYDRRYGTTTPPGDGIELAFVLNPPALYLGRSIHLGPKGPHVPGSVIPSSEVVLRARGAFVPRVRRLQAQLRKRRPARLRLATYPLVKNSLGANHVLLRGGRVLPIDENDDFVNGGHPRTLFGWDARGRLALVTIGSAVPGRRAGVSLPVAAQLMQNLGLIGAVNLDGGGSSTFVDRGKVLNHPSDGSARSVTNAWLVFPRARPRPRKPAP